MFFCFLNVGQWSYQTLPVNICDWVEQKTALLLRSVGVPPDNYTAGVLLKEIHNFWLVGIIKIDNTIYKLKKGPDLEISEFFPKGKMWNGKIVTLDKVGSDAVVQVWNLPPSFMSFLPWEKTLFMSFHSSLLTSTLNPNTSLKNLHVSAEKNKICLVIIFYIQKCK